MGIKITKNSKKLSLLFENIHDSNIYIFRLRKMCEVVPKSENIKMCTKMIKYSKKVLLVIKKICFELMVNRT